MKGDSLSVLLGEQTHPCGGILPSGRRIPPRQYRCGHRTLVATFDAAPAHRPLFSPVPRGFPLEGGSGGTCLGSPHPERPHYEKPADRDDHRSADEERDPSLLKEVPRV